MSAVDLELKKQFQELQIQLVETRAKMKQIDAQMEALKRNCQRNKLTLNEIKALPSETNTYESVGRMFVKKSKADVETLLDKTVESNNLRSKKLEEMKTLLENKLKEKENNLRDFIAQRQQQ